MFLDFKEKISTYDLFELLIFDKILQQIHFDKHIDKYCLWKHNYRNQESIGFESE